MSVNHSLINPELFGLDVWIIGIVLGKREKLELHTVFFKVFITFIIFVIKKKQKTFSNLNKTISKNIAKNKRKHIVLLALFTSRRSNTIVCSSR